MKLAKPVKLMLGVVFAIVGGLTGCQPRATIGSQLRDLAYDSNAKNIALLFGAANGLPGIQDDLNNMKQVLEDPQGGKAFEVVLIEDASQGQILKATQDAAIAVGENGTIFWYFSGHGASDGELMTTQGMLPFSLVTETIRSARSTPVKRMFAMFDSCFSGQMVDGSAAIRNPSSVDNSFGAPSTAYSLVSAGGGGNGITDEYMKGVAENYAGRAAASFYDKASIAKLAPSAYEQMIVMSASQRYETSLAGSSGSEFTNALATVFSEFKTGRANATIGDFLDAVKKQTANSSGGHHTPAFRVMPEQGVLNDTLFAKPRDSNLQNNPGSIQPQALASALIIAIGPGDAASGAARLYAGTDAAIRRVGLCSGKKDACLRNPQIFLEFRDAPAQNVFPSIPSGGLVYESVKPMILEGAKPVTFIGFDAGGKVLATRTIQFRRN